MKIFGIDLTFAYECVSDVFNLMTAYKSMQDKKIERLKEKVQKNEAEDVKIVEEEVKENE